LEIANRLERVRYALLRDHDDALEARYRFRPRKQRAIAGIMDVTRYLMGLQHCDHSHQFWLTIRAEYVN